MKRLFILATIILCLVTGFIPSVYSNEVNDVNNNISKSAPPDTIIGFFKSINEVQDYLLVRPNFAIASGPDIFLFMFLKRNVLYMITGFNGIATDHFLMGTGYPSLYKLEST